MVEVGGAAGNPNSTLEALGNPLYRGSLTYSQVYMEAANRYFPSICAGSIAVGCLMGAINKPLTHVALLSVFSASTLFFTDFANRSRCEREIQPLLERLRDRITHLKSSLDQIDDPEILEALLHNNGLIWADLFVEGPRQVRELVEGGCLAKSEAQREGWYVWFDREATKGTTAARLAHEGMRANPRHTEDTRKALDALGQALDGLLIYDKQNALDEDSIVRHDQHQSLLRDLSILSVLLIPIVLWFPLHD